ncbi:uncharacterized protein LOC127265542 isoform X2 [Andrographis paniculata]|uniref:uncharacterized protein LOC127265542 isoform X2 n=1 Tax=Andrographis paniculata TaxID=175694 RepID=UPI0021E96594|nr:uncharacterized protein LOC127265542 isoform X2 [Andrographis paniculata]
MAKRRSSTRIPDKERYEYTCMWGLSAILKSCHLLTPTPPKLISNGDSSRRFDHLNQECRDDRSEPGLVGVTASARNGGNLIQEDEHGTRNSINSEVVDCLVKGHKRARKNTRMARRLSPPQLSTADTLSDLLSDYFQTRTNRGKYNEIDRISMHQVQIKAKAIADQMFIDSLIRKQGKNSGANYVLNSDKDLFMDLWSDSSTLLSSHCKNTSHLQSVKEAFEPLGRKTMKPGSHFTKRSESVTCHCSPVLSNPMMSDARRKSFSIGAIKKRLKHTFGGFTKREITSHDSIVDKAMSNSDSSKTKRHLQKKQAVVVASDAVRKKLDFSMKQEFDEVKRHLSKRLENVREVEAMNREKSFRTLKGILASPEHDLSQYCSCSAQMRFSPYSNSLIINGRRKGCSSLSSKAIVQRFDGTKISPRHRSKKGEGRGTNVFTADSNNFGLVITLPSVNSFAEVSNQINTTDIAGTIEIKESIKLGRDDENNSLSEDEVSASMVDDLPSTPSSVGQTEVAESNKFQEHQSPVSVLEPLFREDANSPDRAAIIRIALQLHLDYEESSSKSSPHEVSKKTSSCIEELDHHQLSEFVHSVLKASSLNWDRLSETRCGSGELLHYDQERFLSGDCHFDTKLLFDLTNEVLLSLHRSSFRFPIRQGCVIQKFSSFSLEELVIDKIMAEAALYLLPWTEKRTVDDVVSKDVSFGSWLDFSLGTEQITADISEDFLEECILEIVLESLA